MSKKANPTAIGAFTIGALALIVVGVMVFSSGKLFSTTHTLVAVFPESVKGLKIGNPVEFRGVRVGSVKDIKIMYDAGNHALVIPVYMDIVSGKVISADLKQMKPIKSTEKWAEKIQSLIKLGLRAQLDLQSLVTGQMVVAIDFHPEAPGRQTRIDSRFQEIPTMPSNMSRMLDMLENFPLKRLAQKGLNVLDAIDGLARSPELKGLLKQANLAVKDAQTILDDISTTVQPLSDSAKQTLDELRMTVAAMGKQLNLTLKHVSDLSINVNRNVQPLSQSALNALNEAKSAFATVDNLMGSDSVTRANLDEALRQLAGASRSLRILAQYLEQHPDALIKGKGY